MGAIVQIKRKWIAPAWSPLVVLASVAAILYAMSEIRPNMLDRNFVSGSADGGVTIVFRLCGESYQQNCVIDGDTIRYDGAKIRVADIDAPETHDPKCASEAALGERATQRLLGLMNAGPFEVVHAGSRDRDKYGRDLRIIERGGRSITEAMVAEGLARRWDGARHRWCS